MMAATMVVTVTNVTDGPGKSPSQVDIYNKTLAPGASLRIPADLIDQKVRKLEGQGLIAIGQLPSWYTASKNRKGRSLSQEEMQSRIAKPVPPKPQPVVEEKPTVEPTEDSDHSDGRKKRRS